MRRLMHQEARLFQVLLPPTLHLKIFIYISLTRYFSQPQFLKICYYLTPFLTLSIGFFPGKHLIYFLDNKIHEI